MENKKSKADIKSIVVGIVIGVIIGVLIFSAVTPRSISSKKAGELTVNAIKPALDKEKITYEITKIVDKGNFYDVNLKLSFNQKSTNSIISITKDGKYIVSAAPVDNFSLESESKELPASK